MKPRLFIASSKEGVELAKAIQVNLRGHADCTTWEQATFELSAYPLESLSKAVMKNDFAVLVVTPDDQTIKRGQVSITARDNVVFEAGLFMGRYGRDRAFLVAPEKMPDLHLPSDLFGLTLALYDYERTKQDDDRCAALGPACTQIETAIRSHYTANRELHFTVSHKRQTGAMFPSKVWIEITNFSEADVVLKANYFRYSQIGFRSPVAVPAGNPDREEFSYKFRHPNDEIHTYDNYLLKAGQKVDTFVGADPKIEDSFIRQAIENKQIGKLSMTCYWVGSDLTVRNHEAKI